MSTFLSRFSNHSHQPWISLSLNSFFWQQKNKKKKKKIKTNQNQMKVINDQIYETSRQTNKQTWKKTNEKNNDFISSLKWNSFSTVSIVCVCVCICYKSNEWIAACHPFRGSIFLYSHWSLIISYIDKWQEYSESDKWFWLHTHTHHIIVHHH